MSMEDDRLQQICERFDKLHWHDSKLVGFSIAPGLTSLNDEVRLDVDMAGQKARRFTIVFVECALVKLDFDLLGKRYCSDDISNAYCQRDSDLKARIGSGNSYYEIIKDAKLEQNLHFKIKLIEPAGETDILAQNFEIG